MNTVDVITNESGDWIVIQLNGELYEEGHSISVYSWLNLIHKLGNEVKIKEVSDEDMAYKLY